MNPSSRHRASSSRAGMTLLECLVYIACFTIIVNISMTTFVSASRFCSVGMAGLDRLAMSDDMREGVAGTLRQARRVVAGVGAYHTGAETLVVELPPWPQSPAATRYAVLCHIPEKKRMARLLVVEKDGQYTVTAYSTYALPVASLQFRYNNADPLRARLVSVDVETVNIRKGRPPVPYGFSVALRSIVAGGAK